MHALEQLAIMWAAVFVAAVAADRTRLTPVLYFLAIGSLLVNIGWLPEETDPFIRGLAELGIIVIMFALGFEEKLDHFMVSIKRSWGIALFGGLAPFLTTYFLTLHFFDSQPVALMCALAMTATAVSLTMVSLKDEGLANSTVATRIMTSAVLDDVASLALVAVLVPLAVDGNMPDVGTLATIVAKTIGFFLVLVVAARWLLPHDLPGLIGRVPVFGRAGFRHLVAGANGEYAVLTVLLLAVAVGLLAHVFGFHPAVGAYMAGLLLKEEYFQHETGSSWKTTRSMVDSAAFTWIGPVFFVVLGTKLSFDLDVLMELIPKTLLLVAALATAQITAASLAARYTGGMGWAGSAMIGLGMLGRAELAFVVIDIAYVQHSILTEQAFHLLMFSAFFLNLMVPLTIRWWKPRYLAEKESLEPDSDSANG